MSKVKSQNKVFLLALDFTFQVGVLIILPLVIFALLGKLVDERMAATPLFFFIGLLVGLVVACLLVWKKLAEIVREMDSTKSSK